jgi:undecaprenyl diphosphate synthase
VIGRRNRLPAAVLRIIEKTEAATAGGRGLRLRVAIDYSSRDSIAAAARSILAAEPPLPWEAIRPLLMRALTGESGEVDLLIRTGGEKRLSDFLLWESAYAELFFTDRMWPDFGEADLNAALHEFRRRERRFGAVPQPKCVEPVAIPV